MDPVLSMYIAQGIHGLAYGMILFLIASGLNMIFGMMGILNLTHTSFFMLAAYFGYQVTVMTGSFWIALIIAPICTAFVGIILERFFLHKIESLGHMGQLILTFGASMVVLGAIKIFWGTESHFIKMPPILQGSISIAGFSYPNYRLFIIVLSLTVLAFMSIVLYKTRLGKIVQAAVSDAEMVSALGIKTPVIFMLIFGLGTWMAGVAGVVIAPILSVFPGLDTIVGMDAFIVVVTGGLGSVMGAFIVAIIFGLLSSYGVQFVSQLAPLLMVGFMAIVLAIKPTGLMGDRE